MAHLHEIPVRRDGLEADHLVGEIGRSTADTRAEARRGNGAAERAFHLLVATHQFEAVFCELCDERADAHAGLCRDRVVDDIDVADAVQRAHVDDRA